MKVSSEKLNLQNKKLQLITKKNDYIIWKRNNNTTKCIKYLKILEHHKMSLIEIFVNEFMKPILRYTKKNFQYKNTAKLLNFIEVQVFWKNYFEMK